MIFTTPLALLGLLTLPVILALHIRRARTERATVSSLSLWRFLDPQITGAQARRIPLTGLLLADLLIAALLTLALGGIQIDLPRRTQPARHLILLLDTSASMGAADGASTRFHQALADARALLLALQPQDAATVITYGTPARTLGDSRFTNPQLLVTHLQSLSPSSPAADLPAALALATAARDPDLPAEIHRFTDDPVPIPDAPFPIVHHAYGQPASNQAVLSIAAAALSDGKYQVFARFANFGDTPVTRSATLYVDGAPLPHTTTDIALDAHASLAQTWTIIAAPRFVMAVLAGDDALPADDSASLGINPPAALDVALVSAQPGDIARALAAIPGTQVTAILPETYLPGSRFDFVVFENFLPADKPTAHALLIQPPTDPADLPLTALAPLLFDQLILSPHPFTASLDFSGVRSARLVAPEQIALPAWLELSGTPLILAGSQPLLSHVQTGGTQTTLLHADLRSGNFTRHPVFLILISNILEFYRSLDIPDQIQTGDTLWIPSGASVSLLTPAGARHELGACPCQWADTHAPGVYRLDAAQPSGAVQTYWVGANAGSLLESDLAAGQAAVDSGQPPVNPAELEQPLPLTPYLLGLVVLLLLWEAWIAWR
jgi:hypothetical protein